MRRLVSAASAERRAAERQLHDTLLILEVSSKLGRDYWRNPPFGLDAAQWEHLPDRLGLDPHQHVEAVGILAEVRHVVDTELTAHQRRIFIAIVVDGIPLNALAEKLDLQRNAIYKVIFARRRLQRRDRSAARWAMAHTGTGGASPLPSLSAWALAPR